MYTYKVLCDATVGFGGDSLGAVKHPKPLQIDPLTGCEIPPLLCGKLSID